MGARVSDGAAFQEEIADTTARFTLDDLAKIEVLDKAARAAMAAWLYDPHNQEKIDANSAALEARARGLADNGTALLKLARKQLEGR